MAESEIVRGGRRWRAREDGGWEVWSSATGSWQPSDPPPPPPPPPLEDHDNTSAPSADDSEASDSSTGESRHVRTVVLAIATVWMLGAVLWLAGRDWMFDRDPTGPSATAAAAAAACGAQPPPPPRQMQFERAPEPSLRPRVDYWAVIRTSCGDMEVDLLEDEAPRAVNNFVFLARSGFYNGLVWHQVTPDFIIQTGDPNGLNANLPDGPGYTIQDELPKSRRAYVFGAVGFANAGSPGTSGSQFFIVVHDLPGALRGTPSPLGVERTYTIFGRVPEKYFGSVQEIAEQPTMGGTDPLVAVRPRVPVYVNSIEIIERT